MIVALQYHEGDLERTMSLARLLADIEPSPRTDVLLALVCQPGTPRTELVSRTVSHCRRRFSVTEVISEFGALGHPEGCTALWRGTASHFYNKHKIDLRGPMGALLMLDGGDGVPLHPNWLDLLINHHCQTLASGKLITGTPYFMGTCPLHVNPNAVFQLDVFGKTPLLDEMPKYDGTVMTNFDIYHREEMLKHASLSSIIRTDWHGGGQPATLELLRERSERSVWLHGYKDENLYWLTRKHLASRPAPPLIYNYTLKQLRLQESVRRSFEKADQ
jgi:hypothetical protein